MLKLALATMTVIAGIGNASADAPSVIEPRMVAWNIVGDQDMSKVCRQHGLRANCEGMAAWNTELRSCVIWTRSPRSADDISRWQVVHHELKHCQEQHFHN